MGLDVYVFKPVKKNTSSTEIIVEKKSLLLKFKDFLFKKNVE
jgi:hypothetical protein